MRSGERFKIGHMYADIPSVYVCLRDCKAPRDICCCLDHGNSIKAIKRKKRNRSTTKLKPQKRPCSSPISFFYFLSLCLFCDQDKRKFFEMLELVRTLVNKKYVGKLCNRVSTYGSLWILLHQIFVNKLLQYINLFSQGAALPRMLQV